jgi:putative transcriptional regulator
MRAYIMEGWLTGKLLVALPALEDPNFARSIVFLLDHDEDGALGVVINRASDVPVTDAVDTLVELVTTPNVLFGGGPVEPNALVAIGHSSGVGGRLDTTIIDGLQLVDLDQDPVLAGIELTKVRLFAGYAGWAPGQLEQEVWQGAWTVVDAEPADVFTATPETLWHDVLARQRGPLRLLARFPADPTSN